MLHTRLFGAFTGGGYNSNIYFGVKFDTHRNLLLPGADVGNEKHLPPAMHVFVYVPLIIL